MTRPKRSDAYPPAFLHALQRVATTGEDLVIPTDSPHGLRLTFYGLFGALRAEGKPELPSMVSIFLTPPGSITIKPKDATEYSRAIEAALKGTAPQAPGENPPPADDDYEAALARILGGETP